ncbi:hypothetical protein B0T17DRAFT_494179 [Bombardia bombarda]|uniref:PHD and RING finger domain-containing protein n=1 Tax=Bombardia bombarda TaxID=252184 RepID=A0AA39WU70_9PEZI|nr:hypothetical protein B0T17DRAFT_494179 [Bombardia bombarda]
MADQCIVCLEVLEAVNQHHPLAAAPPSPSAVPIAPPFGSLTVPITRPKSAEPPATAGGGLPIATSLAGGPLYTTNVAQIQICGHVLHDACLREWSEKANSCPICRQTFHLVHVYDKVGGKLLSSHEVEDKKQVVEFDPQAWLDENPEDEEINVPCPVCNRSDNEEVLLLCDACDTPYHTHCIGLESIPRGAWFCMECVDAVDPGDTDVLAADEALSHSRETQVRSSNHRQYYFPRTQARRRRERQRAQSDEWQGAWGRISGRIWDLLSLDLDYQDDDDPIVFEGLRRSQQIREQERREHELWQQRLNIASRLGAREVFANNISGVIHGRVSPRPQPPQETREEQRAWAILEKARDADGAANRKRKSRSGTAEPAETQQEPERKLKRPRTRRLPPHNGETQVGESSAAAEAPALPTNQSREPEPNSVANPAPPRLVEGAPSFLSSLLKEVEMSTPSDEESLRTIFGPIPGVNDASSPVGSPSPSGFSSPRQLSITPPPNRDVRRSSPQMTLSSYIEPIYPKANFSPTRSSSPKKHSGSSSPSKYANMDMRSSPENSDSEQHLEHRGRQNGASELQQPQPRRIRPIRPIVLSRSQDVSPARSPLPIEMKESITNIVRSALRPHWRSNQLTTDQYAAINRDVSRKIYEEVRDPAMVPEETKRHWEQLATKEVAQAIADLKA